MNTLVTCIWRPIQAGTHWLRVYIGISRQKNTSVVHVYLEADPDRTTPVTCIYLHSTDPDSSTTSENIVYKRRIQAASGQSMKYMSLGKWREELTHVFVSDPRFVFGLNCCTEESLANEISTISGLYHPQHAATPYQHRFVYRCAYAQVVSVEMELHYRHCLVMTCCSRCANCEINKTCSYLNKRRSPSTEDFVNISCKLL